MSVAARSSRRLTGERGRAARALRPRRGRTCRGRPRKNIALAFGLRPAACVIGACGEMGAQKSSSVVAGRGVAPAPRRDVHPLGRQYRSAGSAVWLESTPHRPPAKARPTMRTSTTRAAMSASPPGPGGRGNGACVVMVAVAVGHGSDGTDCRTRSHHRTGGSRPSLRTISTRRVVTRPDEPFVAGFRLGRRTDAP